MERYQICFLYVEYASMHWYHTEWMHKINGEFLVSHKGLVPEGCNNIKLSLGNDIDVMCCHPEFTIGTYWAKIDEKSFF